MRCVFLYLQSKLFSLVTYSIWVTYLKYEAFQQCLLTFAYSVASIWYFAARSAILGTESLKPEAVLFWRGEQALSPNCTGLPTAGTGAYQSPPDWISSGQRANNWKKNEVSYDCMFHSVLQTTHDSHWVISTRNHEQTTGLKRGLRQVSDFFF